MTTICISVIIVIFFVSFNQFRCFNETQNIKKCLKFTSVDVVVRGDIKYVNLNQNYEIRVEVTPKGFLIPSNAEDVKRIIRCVRMINLKAVTKGGGHSFEKFSSGSNRTWVIDMRKFKKISIDKKNGIAKFGAGITLEEMNDALISEGVILPVGFCYTVGLTGFTLGGGDGVIVRYTGFMVQRVKQINIVSANSRLLKVDDKRHSDLFYALRGAGAQSFGVVTQITYNLIALPTTITVNKIFNNANVIEIFKNWISWAESNPRNEANSILWLNFPKTGQVQLYATIIRGDLNEERRIQSDIQSRFANIYNEDFRAQSFNESYRSIGIYEPKQYLKNIDFYVNKVLNDKEKNTFGTVVKRLVDNCPYCIVYMKMFGGRAKENSNNAFIHSSVLYGISAYVKVEVDDIGEERAREIGNLMINHLNTFLSETTDFDSGQSYQNYVDRNRTDWRKRYFGNIYSKLVKIKQRYDPKNIFTCPQCV